MKSIYNFEINGCKFFCTLGKIQSKNNQIKESQFELLAEYIPELLTTSTEPNKLIWVKNEVGYLWFYRKCNIKETNIK